MIQACLNGVRRQGVPITPAELAAAARGAVAAGSIDVHIHPKSADGVDSMDPDIVAAAVLAVREAIPGVGVGVTTGAWTEPDPARRVALIAAWSVPPDHASVNWHEPGANLVAAALIDRGIGVDAGLFTGRNGLPSMLRSGLTGHLHRLLIEVLEQTERRAIAAAHEMLGAVGGLGLPILLHGENHCAWPIYRRARALGLAGRMGLEDTLTLPDGSPAYDNADLIRAAARLG